MVQHADLSRIVAVDATNGHCPSITLNLSAAATPASRSTPALITLTICEWRRIAEQIVEATRALHA